MSAFVITPMNDWQDITSEVEAPDPPLTFAKPAGVGAFQVSEIRYVRGPVPRPTLADLRTMLVGHIEACGLEATGVEAIAGVRPLAKARATDEGNQCHFWLTVDAGSFLLASYTAACDATEAAAEVRECELMVSRACVPMN